MESGRGRSYLKWCLKQNNGIKLLKPSENLARAYLGKSRNALKSMRVNVEAEIIDWAVSASYYAKYFAVYALFWKLGVKCEIHECTIALFEYLFRGKISDDLIKELRESKESRIEAQYYTTKITVDYGMITRQTTAFVLKIEELIDSLDQSAVAELQSKLREIEGR